MFRSWVILLIQHTRGLVHKHFRGGSLFRLDGGRSAAMWTMIWIGQNAATLQYKEAAFATSLVPAFCAGFIFHYNANTKSSPSFNLWLILLEMMGVVGWWVTCTVRRFPGEVTPWGVTPIIELRRPMPSHNFPLAVFFDLMFFSLSVSENLVWLKTPWPLASAHCL